MTFQCALAGVRFSLRKLPGSSACLSCTVQLRQVGAEPRHAGPPSCSMLGQPVCEHACSPGWRQAVTCQHQVLMLLRMVLQTCGNLWCARGRLCGGISGQRAPQPPSAGATATSMLQPSLSTFPLSSSGEAPEAPERMHGQTHRRVKDEALHCTGETQLEWPDGL